MRLDDPMKSKHLKRALEQLAEEGVTRIFKPLIGGDFIVGVVGALQLDVLAARIKAEYELGVRFEAAPYETARWVAGRRARAEALRRPQCPPRWPRTATARRSSSRAAAGTSSARSKDWPERSPSTRDARAAA